MVISEESGITDYAMIESCRHFVPKFTSERSFKSLSVDEILLKRGKSNRKLRLMSVRNRLGTSSGEPGS